MLLDLIKGFPDNETPIKDIYNKKLKGKILAYVDLKNKKDLGLYSKAKRFLLRKKLEREKNKLERGCGLSIIDGKVNIWPGNIGFRMVVLPNFMDWASYMCTCCVLNKTKYKLTNLDYIREILTQPQKL